MGIEIIRGHPGREYNLKGISGGKLDIKEEIFKNEGTSDNISLHSDDIRAKDTGYFEDKALISEALEKLKHTGEIFNRRLDFRIHEETHRVVVKVIDTETDKVIKEIPPEQILQLAARIQEMIGLLVDEER
ncbi:MAG: flagellar protein FlaG [Spirochaetes bacterium]|nr:flagellar protein FlaG [Spirochaetota bacterium]